MAVENIHDRLAEFEHDWQNTDTNGKKGEYKNPPDGVYQVKIDECRFENAKTSGRLQLAWVFRVVSPMSMDGKPIYHYRGLDGDASVSWMKREIYACGLHVDSIKELPGNLPYLIDRVIEITLKTTNKNGKEYQNLYVNKLIMDAPDNVYGGPIPF